MLIASEFKPVWGRKTMSRRLSVCGVLCLSILFLGNSTHAITVDLGTVQVQLDDPGGGCVKVDGEYDGFRIVPPEAGKTPKVCSLPGRKNLLVFLDVTIVATGSGLGERTIRVEDHFATGPIGRVFARVELIGFFATGSGGGVPSGNSVVFTGMLNQGGTDTVIGEAIEHTVGEELESGLLNEVSRSEFLISGDRSLKLEVKFDLKNEGDKLVLSRDSAVVLDSVTRQQD